MKPNSLTQAELDRAYMRGVLDMEKAIEQWLRSNISDGDALGDLINGLMGAMYQGCAVPEDRLATMRKYISHGSKQ